jgi:hypothetical protein
MLKIIPLTALAAVLVACASYTADYQARLTSALPNNRDVTFTDTRRYPGPVLCGNYAAPDGLGYYPGARPYIVGPDFVLRSPDETDLQVLCSDDPRLSLYGLLGIGGSAETWEALRAVRDDFVAIDQALRSYYLETSVLPRSLTELATNTEELEEEPFMDPWERPYRYEAGLSGGTAPNYTLLTMGADGQIGGRGADADINRTQLHLLAHGLQLGD